MDGPILLLPTSAQAASVFDSEQIPADLSQLALHKTTTGLKAHPIGSRNPDRLEATSYKQR